MMRVILYAAIAVFFAWLAWFILTPTQHGHVAKPIGESSIVLDRADTTYRATLLDAMRDVQTNQPRCGEIAYGGVQHDARGRRTGDFYIHCRLPGSARDTTFLVPLPL